MITNLFEQYHPSENSLNIFYQNLKKKYFEDGDISDKLKISVKYSTSSALKDSIASFAINPEDIENFKNGESVNCYIFLNDDVIKDNDNFDKDLLEEVLLHEMIHAYQLSKHPDNYSSKSEEHDNVFKDKVLKIEEKLKYKIRTHVDVNFFMSQKRINNYVKELLKNIKLVFISTLETDFDDFDKVTLVPEKYFEKIIEYLKRRYSTFFFEEGVGDKFYEYVKQINIILGKTKETILKNSIMLDLYIKENSFIPCLTNKSSLSVKTIERLNSIERKQLN